MHRDGKHGVGARTVRVHQRGGGLPLGAALAQHVIHVVLGAHQHLLQPLDDAGALPRPVLVYPGEADIKDLLTTST